MNAEPNIGHARGLKCLLSEIHVIFELTNDSVNVILITY